MSVPQTLYITGISRPATENPISQRHRVLFLAFLQLFHTGRRDAPSGRGPLLGPLPQIDLSRHQAGSHQMDKLEFRASFSPFITLVLSLRSRPQRA